MSVEPKPADKFTFGLWTVGWQARYPLYPKSSLALHPHNDSAGMTIG